MPVSVLLVESDASHAQAVVQALVDPWLGWAVVVAPSLADARQALATQHFDVLVTAEHFEGGSAFEVLELARGTPALMAVPFGRESEAAHAMRHGFGDFLVQDPDHAYLLTLPAQIEAVLEHSSAVLARHHAESQLARQNRILHAISEAQALFIGSGDPHSAFGVLLRELLAQSHSRRGFIVCTSSTGDRPEVLHLITAAAIDGTPMENLPAAVEVAPDGLLRKLLATEVPVLGQAAAADTDLAAWLPGAPYFIGIPVPVAGEMSAFIGLADRVSGYAHADIPALQPLFNTVGQMEVARRAALARHAVEEQLADTTALLREKTRALEVTLDTVSQGITNVDADGRIRVYNRRYLELLDLPDDLLARIPLVEEVVHYQTERGDFGEAFQLIDASARGYVAAEYAAGGGGMPQMPDVYLRRTPAGRYLEIRTRPLETGGRVRTFSDVTDYVATQDALRTSEARWRSMTHLSSDWYWEQDAQLRYMRVRGGQERPANLFDDAHYGMTRWDLPHGGVSDAQWRAHRARLDARETFYDFEMQLFGSDGAPVWVSISGEPIFDAEGQFDGYRGVARNITDRKLAEAEIERLAFYDELTGLPNRRLLLDRVDRALRATGRDGSNGALLFLDLDNFKDINDTLGHEWGDRLLVQVAERAAIGLRANDTVARLGGDEFVVLLLGLSPEDTTAAVEVESIAQKLLSTLNQPYDVAGRNVHSTPSIGIALFRGQTQSVHDLLQRADLAMYQAKAQGRNTLCFFDPNMQAAATARSALEADMRMGLQRDEFVLHYQPVVDARGTALGMEALVRWQHPQRALVMPGEFIALAEQTGLILPLGRLVLRLACAQLARWAEHPVAKAWTLSVNVSAYEFRHAEFVPQVLEALRHSGANPQHLKLELTESLLLHDVEDGIAKMQQLRAKGVGFSLDDFGTGYSSLSYLKRLPLDQLKIDQSFVRDVLTDPNDAAIACTVVALAHSLGLDVVAEGVETDGQREFLLRNGCTRFQGYLFGRPAPAEHWAEALASL